MNEIRVPLVHTGIPFVFFAGLSKALLCRSLLLLLLLFSLLMTNQSRMDTHKQSGHIWTLINSPDSLYTLASRNSISVELFSNAQIRLDLL